MKKKAGHDVGIDINAETGQMRIVIVCPHSGEQQSQTFERDAAEKMLADLLAEIRLSRSGASHH